MPLDNTQRQKLTDAYTAWLNSAGRQASDGIATGTSNADRARALVPQFMTWLRANTDAAHNDARTIVAANSPNNTEAEQHLSTIAQTQRPQQQGQSSGFGLGNLISGLGLGGIVGMLSGNWLIGIVAAVAGGAFLPGLLKSAFGIDLGSMFGGRSNTPAPQPQTGGPQQPAVAVTLQNPGTAQTIDLSAAVSGGRSPNAIANNTTGWRTVQMNIGGQNVNVEINGTRNGTNFTVGEILYRIPGEDQVRYRLNDDQRVQLALDGNNLVIGGAANTPGANNLAQLVTGAQRAATFHRNHPNSRQVTNTQLLGYLGFDVPSMNYTQPSNQTMTGQIRRQSSGSWESGWILVGTERGNQSTLDPNATVGTGNVNQAGRTYFTGQRVNASGALDASGTHFQITTIHVLAADGSLHRVNIAAADQQRVAMTVPDPAHSANADIDLNALNANVAIRQQIMRALNTPHNGRPVHLSLNDIAPPDGIPNRHSPPHNQLPGQGSSRVIS